MISELTLATPLSKKKNLILLSEMIEFRLTKRDMDKPNIEEQKTQTDLSLIIIIQLCIMRFKLKKIYSNSTFKFGISN